MRAFIALDLPLEFRREIKRVQDLLKKNNLFTGKFTEGENLHLTLKFLGEIEDKKLEGVKKKLKDVRFEEFDARLGDVGVFSKKFIKIIWVELLGAEKLQREIDDKLKDLFEPEARFMSHITVARVKKVGDKKALLKYLEGVRLPKLKFRVESFCLMKSELFPEGPVYDELGKYRAS